MSKSKRAQGQRPPKAGRPWTAHEDCTRTGRTLAAVYLRRWVLGMPDLRRLEVDESGELDAEDGCEFLHRHPYRVSLAALQTADRFVSWI